MNRPYFQKTHNPRTECYTQVPFKSESKPSFITQFVKILPYLWGIVACLIAACHLGITLNSHGLLMVLLKTSRDSAPLTF